jgi:type I pantothenate kinase
VADVSDLVARLEAARQDRGVFVVGLTGSVAVGKTTLAQTLQAEFQGAQIVSTDGFLRPNVDLDAAGLAMRKGFPESYDVAALHGALTAVRAGPAVFRGYSHTTYDVDPALARTLDRPPVLIVEGLSLTRATPLDTLIYLDADDADIEAWFTARLLGLLNAGRDDPASFYARFAHFDAAASRAFAASVWANINRPNLIEHILPVRETADIVVRKGGDHRILDVRDRLPR